MRASELRIGNLVGVPYGCGFIEVRQEELSEKAIYDSCLQPIPLTEKWLIKFGFVGAIRAHKIIYKGTVIELSLEDNYVTVEDGAFDIVTIPKKVKYVHQLQNLYHALTNTELKIKE